MLELSIPDGLYHGKDLQWSSSFFKNCSPWEGPMLEKFVKDCILWEEPTLEQGKSVRRNEWQGRCVMD